MRNAPGGEVVKFCLVLAQGGETDNIKCALDVGLSELRVRLHQRHISAEVVDHLSTVGQGDKLGFVESE
jgi:hypothetical protein